MKLKVLELFGGIGACSKALERIGIEEDIVDYVEIDKYAVKSFNAIFGTNFEPQDICEWDKDIEVDLIMHGSPCQDFSIAGLQAGGDIDSGTRSSLMYETIRIVKKLKPKYVIWENVKNLLSKKHRHNFDKYLETMEEIGYKNYYQLLNAKDYGIPQNRERVFTISIRNDIQKEFQFPMKQELKLKLKDMLDKEVEEKCYLSDDLMRHIQNTAKEHEKYTQYSRYNGELEMWCRVWKDISPTLNTKCKDTKIYIENNLKIRKLTPKECWRLMGFNDEDFEKASKVNSNSQLYKQAGNSIVVNVLEEIFKELFKEENNESSDINREIN